MENFTSETAYSLFHKLVKRFQDGCFSKMLYAVQQKVLIQVTIKRCMQNYDTVFC